MPPSAVDAADYVLRVRDLVVDFASARGAVRAVDGLSLEVRRGETTGLVGESGCGKSVTALSICRLLPASPATRVTGDIVVDGTPVLGLPTDEMRSLRGKRIGFIFQDPMTSLNPVLSIGEQLTERMRVHLGLSRKAASSRAIELLTKVGMARAHDRLSDYPHHLSGGMRQRVVIAMAISCDPVLLIADEPTTALDVTIQGQILDALAELASEGMAIVLITHDLGVAARMCDSVRVMYAGRIVEAGPADRIYADPRSPYTLGLLRSVARLDVPVERRLAAIPGFPPDATVHIDRCRFAPRCLHARSICTEGEPGLTPRHPDHLARCWGTEADGWIA